MNRGSLFISYSRKDTELVRRLHDRLIEHSLDLWVDWEGIPPSAEWLDEIYTAIDGSDTFVQVLSPDSLESTVCQLELDRAVRNNKRLIAVVCRDVPVENVPEALSQINWIFLRETDDFEESVTRLLAALRTDLDWARVHTRLLVRAINWDNRRRPRALCLSGRELKEHKSWIVRIGDKQPEVTELQHAYLAESQKALRRRQTIITAVTVCVLVGGGLLWWYADRQSGIARARRISLDAEAARLAAPANAGKALALAVEAVARFHSMGIRSLNAENTLRRQLHLWPEPITAFDRQNAAGNGTGGVSAMAFTDSNELTVRYIDGAIHRLGIRDRSVLSRMKPIMQQGEAIVSGNMKMMVFSRDGGIAVWPIGSKEEPTVLDTPYQPWRIAVSPNGNRIAVKSGLRTYVILDAPTGSEHAYGKMVHHDGVDVLFDMAVADQGHRVAVIEKIQVSQVSYRSVASVLDLKTEQRRILLDGYDPLWRIVMSPDGSRVVIPAGKKGTIVFDTESGAEIRRIETGDRILYAGFNPSGSRLATVDDRHQARVWHLATGVELARIGLPDLAAPVVFSPDDSLLAVCRESGRISIYSTRSLGDGRAFVHNEPVNTVTLDDVGHIATASGTVDGFGALTLWDSGSGMMQKEWRLDDFILGDRVALSNDGRYMLLGTGTPVACSATRTRIWSIEDDREISAIDHGVCGAPASLSADGRFFAYTRFNGQIEVLELPAGEIRDLGSGPLTSLKFSESGSHLAAGFEDGHLKVWDTNDWQVVFEPGTRLPDGYGFLTLDPAGTKLAVTTGDNIVLVFSRAGGSAGLRLEHLGRVTSMAFGSGGTHLATGADDGRARIWSTATGDELAQFPHSAGVSAVSFGKNDTTLVTASADGYARIWSVQDRTEIGRLAHGARLTDLAVSKNGQAVITAGRDGVVWQWYLKPEDLIHQACIRLPADLIPKSGKRAGDFKMLPASCTPQGE